LARFRLDALPDLISDEPDTPVLELSPKQIGILEKIAANGFAIVAFPLYASAVGVRKGNCAALLIPALQGGMKLLGEPCWLVDTNLSVRVRRGGVELFVWKKQEVEATPERLAEVGDFRRELEDLLAPRA
jgi:hypothetical protein